MPRSYHVPADVFFGVRDPRGKAFFDHYPVGDSRSRCREPMEQLVRRFELAGKSVVSVGAGAAHEEMWLWNAGCRLTLVDLDESGTIEPFLRAIAVPEASDTLEYVIGDAKEFFSSPDGRKFDVVYASSFTPEEMRRRGIQEAHRQPFRIGLNRLLERLTGRAPFALWSWPKGTAPVCDILVDALRNVLRDGGLFIEQSYAGGVDPLSNPHFAGDLGRQLRRLGLVLGAFYRWDPPWSAVTLAVAFKGSLEAARAYAERIERHPELTCFHGRSTLKVPIGRIPTRL